MAHTLERFARSIRAREHESSDVPPDPLLDRGHLENGLRRAVESGLEAGELAEVRASMLCSLDQAIEREPTQSRLRIVNSMRRAAEERDVLTDAAFYPNLKPKTLDALAQAFPPSERAPVLVVHSEHRAASASEAAAPTAD